MKVLVIGGNRFFGKRLVHLLLARGDQVTVLNRGHLADDFGDRVIRIRCDRTDARDFDRAVGSSNWDVVYDQVCYDADTAEAACRIFFGKVGKYIFTSTKSVYSAGANLSEADFDPWTHTFTKRENYNSNYGEAKRQAETMFFQKKAFPVTAARMSLVFGVDDYTGRLKFHINRVAAQSPIYFPNLQAHNCYVHSPDAAQVLFRLSELDAAGPINVCSPDTLTIRELLNWIEDAVHAKAVVVSKPELGETSPIGIPSDWYMSTQRLKSLGIELPKLEAWLPKLIRDIAEP